MYSTKIFPGLLITLILIFSSCQNDDSINIPIYGSIDTLKSLQSLNKLDDYPFYTMTIYGDYGFAEYLNIGSRSNSRNDSSDPAESIRCTCFAAFSDSGKVFGRNFDWRHHEAMLLFTDPPDGYASAAMVDIYYCFNQSNVPLNTIDERLPLLAAPYLSFDGINEMGVSVGIMAVDHAEPPYNPSRISLNDLDVVRLVLDYAGSVSEAVELIEKYNVRFDSVPLHYLIADRNGNSVIIEFVDKHVLTFFNSADYQVCTNFIIDEYAPDLSGHCWRYDLAYNTLSDNSGFITDMDAMDLLRRVSQGNTMWSAVYNLSGGSIYISAGRKYSSVYNFSLNDQ